MDTYMIAALCVYGLGILLTALFLVWEELQHHFFGGGTKGNLTAAMTIAAIALAWPLLWCGVAGCILAKAVKGRSA